MRPKNRPRLFGIGVFVIVLLWRPALPSAASAPDPLPGSLSPAVATKAQEVESKLLQLDCPFLVQVLHPKDTGTNELGFCMYPLRIERGIFRAVACVGVLVEPDSGTRNAFYGAKGHWGIEGECDSDRLLKKLRDPEIDKTVNPITSLRIKREEGMILRRLRDEFGLWTLFEERTRPKKEINTKKK